MRHANPPNDDLAGGSARAGGLTPPQKAAAILVAMGKPAAGRLLKFFKHDELKALVEAARLLRTIPQSELEKIVAEFEAEFTEGAGLLDSGDQMDTLLNEAFSPEEIEILMGNRQAAIVSDGPAAATVWTRIEGMEPGRIAELLKTEHPQTVALVLSNLKPQPAAAVVLTFDKPVRSEIVKRMLAMTPVQPAARRLIETQLQARLSQQSRTGDQAAGQARVASLLNEFEKSELDEMLDDLSSTGQVDVASLKAQLFSFDDIVRLDMKSRVALFDGISPELVTMALREASTDLQEAALSAIGARSRRMIEAELGAAMDVNIDAILRARKSIASTALRLAGQGLVELPSLEAAA